MKKTIAISLLAFSSLFGDAEIDILKEQLAQQKIIMQKFSKRVFT